MSDIARIFITLALVLPALSFGYVWLHRDDKAEAGHIVGLVLVGSIITWALWVSFSILWIVWHTPRFV